MSRLLGITYRLRSLLRRRVADRETHDEIAYHLECAERAYLARGLPADEARHRALREFGGAAAWRDAAASVRSGALLEEIVRDVRLALRSFRHRPGLVTGVVLTLALGIGANVAIYGMMNAVLLRPVPVPDPDRVVVVFQAADGSRPFERTSYPEYQDLASRSTRLTGLAAVATYPAALQATEWSDQIRLALVSGSYFPVLGVRPSLGRLLGRADEAALGTTPYLVLSHGYWATRFGADPAAVGRTVRIGQQPFTIVGVAPRGFHGADLGAPPDAWAPMTMHMQLALGGMFGRAELLTNRVVPLAFLVGRLDADATAAEVEAELNTNLAAIRSAHSPPRINAREIVPNPISVLPVSSAATFRDRSNLVRFIAVMVGTVLLTLLLACVNVANLLGLRGRERSRELGVRLALGAGTGRVVRQLLTENLLLALLGGTAGLAVAWSTGRLLTQFTLPGGVRLDRVESALDAGVLAFAVLLSVVTALVFGLGPALASGRRDVATALRSGADRVTRRGGAGVLIAVQVAISLTLLVGASLFVRSVRAGLDTDLGFDPGPLVGMDVEPRLLGYRLEQTTTLINQIVERAGALPGVVAAAAAQHVPLSPLFTIPLGDGPARPREGRAPAPPAGDKRRVEVGMVSVTPDFLRVMGIPLLAGRGVEATDRAGQPSVVVVNQAAADAFWPGESPIGRQLNLFDSYTYTVVGVARDVKPTGMTDSATPMAYAAFEQEGAGRATIVMRSRDPARTLLAVRELAHELNARVPVMNVRHVSEQVDRVLMPQRFGATLLSAFGLLAFAISAVGLYSTVAYAASRRTAEIGVRLALGARRSSVIWLLFRDATIAVAVGFMIGAAAAVGAAGWLGQFLYGVRPLDPTAFLAAMVLLAVGAALAAVVPASRASRIDPARTLRTE